MNTTDPQSTGTEDSNQTTTPLIKNLDSNEVLMAALAYLGPLLLIPLITSREQSFVRYHLRQGIVLFGLYLAVQVVMSMFMFAMWMWPLMSILNFGILALIILGIVHVVKKQEAPLPLIGSLASYIKL